MASKSGLIQFPLRSLVETLSIRDPEIFDRLDRTEAKEFDELGLGAIAFQPSGNVERFNAIEARRSGLRAADVIGKNFFSEVAPCTNNSIIGDRFLKDDILDAELEYVFTYRLIPTKVRLRLLKRPSSPLMYMLVRIAARDG